MSWGVGEVPIAWVCDPRGWGTRAGESSPCRAQGSGDRGPRLGARLLIVTTCRVGLRQERGFLPVARRLREGWSWCSDQRRTGVGAGGKAGLGCRVDRDPLSAGRDQAQGILTFLNTEFVALHTAGTLKLNGFCRLPAAWR